MSRGVSAHFLEIDGSYLEGGGQILRNALSLSCIMRKPIRVTNIRANRPNPGLSNQHLYGLNLLQQITNANVKGNFIRSTTVEFEPDEIKFGQYFIDSQTAASLSLMAQAALPVLLFAEGNTELELIGGTNVEMAPQVDFLTEIVWPNLEQFGVSLEFELLQRGYYPRGGGRCKFLVYPLKKISAANITKFGLVNSVSGWCFVAGKIPANIASDIKSTVVSELSGYQDIKINIEAYKENHNMAKDNASGVILKASTDKGCVVGSSALGERIVNPHKIAKIATKELQQYIQCRTCVDQHVQDQLIIFMALADGISRIETCEITNHTKTAIHVAELMTGVRFNILPPISYGNSIIECHGCGIINKYLKNNI